MQPPSHHRNATSWSNRSPNTVLDHFAFSQPDVITTSSKSVHPGRSSQAAPRRSSTSVFSQFLFTSVSNNNPPSMKFRFSKTPAYPKHTNISIKSIPSTLYDDPAFSDDPLSHPFFATSHDAAWAPPPAPTTSSMDPNTPPSVSFASPVNFPNTDSFKPLMLPNEASTSAFYDGQSSSTTNASESQPSLTPPSTAPTSVDSHQPLDVARKPVEVPHPLPQKKKNSIAMFWRKSETIEKPSKHEQPDNKRHESPPSYDTVTSARPPHSRGLSAPEIPHSVDRPNMPPRPATTAVDAKPPSTASKRIIGGRHVRAHELDRIDELDESNPLGIAVHHGGPYEAIQKVVGSMIPHNIGSQYQDRSHKAMGSKGHPNYYPASGPPPTSASLNLTPGQVLPHNFQAQYHPQQGFVNEPAAHSRLHEPPQAQARTGPGKHRSVDSRQDQASNMGPHRWSNHHFSKPAGSGMPPAEDPQRRSTRHMSQPVEPVARSSADNAPPKQKHRSVPYERSPSNLASFEQTGVGPVKTGVRTSVISNPQYPSQPQLQPHVQMQHRGFDGGLSNGHAHDDARQDEMMTSGQSVGYAQPSDVALNLDITKDSEPTHAHFPPDEERGGRDPSYALEPARFEPPSHFAGAVYSAPSTNTRVVIPDGRGSGSDNQPASQQRQSRDGRSSHQSIAGTGSSSHSQNGGKAPQPRHVPKRLVMPTPLQPSQLNAPYVEPVSYPAQTQYPLNYPIQPQQLYSRPPSPPSVLPHVGGPQSHGKFTRAKEIPMSQSKKLKKRSILGVDNVAAPAPPAAHIALSFEPTITSAEPLHNPPPPTRSKLGKAPKKVLSKRRTDL